MMDQNNQNISGEDTVKGVAFVNGAFVTVKKDELSLKEKIMSFPEEERRLLMKMCIGTHPNEIKNERVVKFYNDNMAFAGKIALLLKRSGVTVRSVTTDLPCYTSRVEKGKFGSATTFKCAGTTKVLEMRVEVESNGFPKLDKVASQMFASCFKMDKDRAVAHVPNKSAFVSQFYPKGNVFRPYAAVVQDSAHVDGIFAKSEAAFVGMKGSAKDTILGMVQRNVPTTLIKGGKNTVALTYRQENGKDVPGSAQIWPMKLGPLDTANMKDEDVVDVLVKLSTGLPSPKTPRGIISETHMDGNLRIRGNRREKHEWITDYVHVEAPVYIIDTKDLNFVAGMYRRIRDNRNDAGHLGPFAVVYNATKTDVDQYEKLFHKSSGGGITVVKTGVIGIDSYRWPEFKMGAYYISFASYTTGKGSGTKFMEASAAHRSTMSYRAKQFNEYMYYGHVAAMTNTDRCIPSSRARKGTVVYHSQGGLGRSELLRVCVNAAHHSMLALWCRDSFLAKDADGKYLFDGTREYEGEFNFSPLDGKEDKLMLDFSMAHLEDGDTPEYVAQFGDKTGRTGYKNPHAPRVQALPAEEEVEETEQEKEDRLLRAMSANLFGS